MSHPLVSHSPDLQHLEQEGYDLEVRGDRLLIKHVPYVNSDREVVFGTLISDLTTNGTRTVGGGVHDVWFIGSPPCDKDGREIDVISNRAITDFGSGLVANFSFSQRPKRDPPEFLDYYEKVTTYVRILRGPALAIDPSATAQTFPPQTTTEEETVFRYLDAASSRAGIGAVTEKLKLNKVAIVGLGGTGSYILDLITKTPIQEIHLYDDDTLFAHNAFRFPGAASIEELEPMPKKVDYLFAKYDPMRRNLFPHAARIDRTNVAELLEMDFVFIAMDAGSIKKLIVNTLQAGGVPFIDSGMGLRRNENSLRGTIRVTSSTNGHTDHIGSRISFVDESEDDYEWNIQTADLNMLNAALAVIKWKKIFEFYVDGKGEFNSNYTLASNQLTSGDVPQ
jgi:hypothetical protein